IRSQSVSVRRRRGPLAGGLAVELIRALKIKPHYPAEITGFGGGPFVVCGDANPATRRSSTNSSRILYGRDILSNEKAIVLKRFLPKGGATQEFDANSVEFGWEA